MHKFFLLNGFLQLKSNNKFNKYLKTEITAINN